MLVERFKVDSPNCEYTDDAIISTFRHENTELEPVDGQWIVTPTTTQYDFRTSTHVPKLGCVCAAL
jgi:myo-inositol-1-phosphate synthase